MNTLQIIYDNEADQLLIRFQEKRAYQHIKITPHVTISVDEESPTWLVINHASKVLGYVPDKDHVAVLTPADLGLTEEEVPTPSTLK